jgi:enoyl-CoA hydratase/carnithine racemase
MNEPEVVQFDIITARGGYKIGMVSLNRPAFSNALTIRMADKITSQLERWAQAKRVIAVILRGNGPRGFCAGMDFSWLREANHSASSLVETSEKWLLALYRMYLALKRFTKPLIVWGHGQINGAGVGLFLSGNHRIACEDFRLSWQVGLAGLFPGALAGYYLPRLPSGMGLWMGLTGAPINTEDAATAEFASYRLSSDSLNYLIEDLRRLEWTDQQTANHQRVKVAIETVEQECVAPKVESNWKAAAPLIQPVFENDQLFNIPIAGVKNTGNSGVSARGPNSATSMNQVEGNQERLEEALARLAWQGNSWVKNGVESLEATDPVVRPVALELYKRGKQLSLAKAAMLEMALGHQLIQVEGALDHLQVEVQMPVAKKHAHNSALTQSARSIGASFEQPKGSGLPGVTVTPALRLGTPLNELFGSPWATNRHPLGKI